MVISSEIKLIIEKAESGCPKCQYIMGYYFLNGIGVPKSKSKSLEYSIMLSQHPENELQFIKKDGGYDYGWLLTEIGVIAFSLGKLEISESFTSRAKDFFLKTYTVEKAESLMKRFRIEARLAMIQESKNQIKPVIWFNPS